jgi:hypothetical protein
LKFVVVGGRGHRLVGAKQPRRGRRQLVVDHAIFGASTKVDEPDIADTVKEVGYGAAAVPGWQEWREALKAQDTQLLVLLPHTDYNKRTLEIAATTLATHRGQVRHRRARRRSDCRALQLSSDKEQGRPTGFATPFARKGASVVFHSSTDLLNSHASELARRLVKELATAGRRRRMVSDALTEFRRKAVEEGWVLAFAISAFGDADWRV